MVECKYPLGSMDYRIEKLVRTIWNKICYAVCWLGHPLLGAFTIELALAYGEITAAAWVYMYVKYQIREAKDVGDLCWVDIRDFMIGFGVRAAAGVIRRYL